MFISRKFIIDLFETNIGIDRYNKIIKEYKETKIDEEIKIVKETKKVKNNGEIIREFIYNNLKKYGICMKDICIFGSYELDTNIKNECDVDVTLNIFKDVKDNLQLKLNNEILNDILIIYKIFKCIKDEKIKNLIYKPSKRCPMISFVFNNVNCDLTIDNK